MKSPRYVEGLISPWSEIENWPTPPGSTLPLPAVRSSTSVLIERRHRPIRVLQALVPATRRPPDAVGRYVMTRKQVLCSGVASKRRISATGIGVIPHNCPFAVADLRRRPQRIPLVRLRRIPFVRSQDCPSFAAEQPTVLIRINGGQGRSSADRLRRCRSLSAR
jgi:hypothetical protein